jgi:hypothetical protein
MYIFYKIINAIDGILNQIPEDLATNIKRLSGFIFFILAIVALYMGYQAGVADSKIPGPPLVNETNDALRLRLKDQAKGSGMNLVESPPPILDVDNPQYLHKERMPQKSDLPSPRDSDVLGEGSIRGLDPQDMGSSKKVFGLDQNPLSGGDSATGHGYRSTKQAKAPSPLSDRFRHFSRVGAKPKSRSGPSQKPKDKSSQTSVHTPLLPEDFSPMEEPGGTRGPASQSDKTKRDKKDHQDQRKPSGSSSLSGSSHRSTGGNDEKKQKPEQVQPLDPFD